MLFELPHMPVWVCVVIGIITYLVVVSMAYGLAEALKPWASHHKETQEVLHAIAPLLWPIWLFCWLIYLPGHYTYLLFKRIELENERYRLIQEELERETAARAKEFPKS